MVLEKLIGDFDDFVDFDVLLDILQVFKDNCKLVLDDVVFAVDDDGYREEFDVLHAVV